jgi:hypothetical protein
MLRREVVEREELLRVALERLDGLPEAECSIANGQSSGARIPCETSDRSTVAQLCSETAGMPPSARWRFRMQGWSSPTSAAAGVGNDFRRPCGGKFGERRRYGRDLRASLRRLRTWAQGGPDFVHMVSILEAERARLQGKSDRAREHYLYAAERATAQDFLHHAALAHERRALLLGGLRREVKAENALAQAATLYEQWGARHKADLLRSPDALTRGAP